MIDTCEVWLPVVGLEDSYEVSSLGRVRSLDRVVSSRFGTRVISGRVRKQTLCPSGYARVQLYPPGTNSTKRVHVMALVHRLVAEAFVSRTSSAASEVNHIDFSRSNNRADNLEWVSPSENVQHSVRAGRWAAAHNSATNPKKWKKLSLEVVRELIAAVDSGEKTRYRVAKDLGVSCSLITRIFANRSRYITEPPASSPELRA